MKPFNVLQRDLPLHQNYLLEASAGTGKTFSIQNIIVRLLIEPRADVPPIPIEQILVVTFTRAATRELKSRVRATIEQSLNQLQEWQHHDIEHLLLPDYLMSYVESGKEAVQRICHYLQQALFLFDQAQIFTIHGFCARMLRQFVLESDVGLTAVTQEDGMPVSEMHTIVRDFFRTEVHMDKYSPAQLDILLKEDPNQRQLVRILQGGRNFAHFRSFKENYLLFIAAMHQLKQQFTLNAQFMLEDFAQQASAYRNHKNGVTKADTLERVTRFASLCDLDEWDMEIFDQLIYDGLVWVEALDHTLLKKKAPPQEELHYPYFTSALEKVLLPCITEARSFSNLLARAARDCRELLVRYQEEEEYLTADDILRQMHSLLQHPPFRLQIQSLYQAAIIDEFQDTDPLQWEIFEQLFIADKPSWNGYLYLVGDPKQSIYSFRQADIYTYLSAAKVLGETNCFSLNVNYRSHPTLVKALNNLFSSNNLSGFMPLPKINSHLIYQPVAACENNHSSEIVDDKQSIHFFIADRQTPHKCKTIDLENKVFFPFMVQEMICLHQQSNIAFSQIAVLVRDRYQAMRLTTFFDSSNIPYVNQRGTSLLHCSALQSLIDLLRAIIRPQDRGLVRIALASPLMRWTYDCLKKTDELEQVMIVLPQLKMVLFEKGFAVFFHELLHLKYAEQGPSILEQILKTDKGIEFYQDLQQIVDLIIDHQYKEWHHPEGIIAFLDNFHVWSENEDHRVKRLHDPMKDGVKILTLHMSKGLEFDIVFALGLVNRTEIEEHLIDSDNEKRHLVPVIQNSAIHHLHCEERDAEKMRQLYVALTRAKRRLYIPIALHLLSENLQLGEASPIELYLARLLAPPNRDYPMLYDEIKKQTGANLFEFLEMAAHRECMSYSIHQELPSSSLEKRHYSDHVLLAPSGIVIAKNKTKITTFSTLEKQLTVDRNDYGTMATSPPYDYEHKVKNIHTIPSNRDTGSIVHQILKKINFADFINVRGLDNILPIIRPFLQKTALKEWENEIGTLILNAFTTTLPLQKEACSLSNISQMYREMPFMFPYNIECAIEELGCHGGLIKGVVDLLFYHAGYYYMIDWKTNWLGPSTHFYHRTELENAMHDNHYFLQAAIYTEAIKRYLAIVESRSFEECFGGIFYIFMRGFAANLSTGIYHFFSDGLNNSFNLLGRIPRSLLRI